MRWWLVAIAVIVLSGCTPLRLQRGTVRQGSTVAEIQYQQVLDNLAHFACDPDALAWHVKVLGGLVQVSDQGGGGILPSGVHSPLIAPSVAVNRNILGQWNIDAVIEADDLELLQIAYQKAINPADERRELKKQAMEKICEISTEHHLVLSREVTDDLIATLKFNAAPARVEKLNYVHARLRELYARVEALAVGESSSRIHPLPVPEPAANAPRVQQPSVMPPSISPELLATKREIIRAVASITNQPFVGDPLEKQLRGPMRIEQAEDKIHALVELFGEKSGEPNAFALPWVQHGCKKDVPNCACHVGHFKGCEGDCYVWVMPQQAKTLRDFVLIILSLVPPEPQEPSGARGVGAAFSPNS